jgi:hypothetical protein
VFPWLQTKLYDIAPLCIVGRYTHFLEMCLASVHLDLHLVYQVVDEHHIVLVCIIHKVSLICVNATNVCLALCTNFYDCF